MENKRPGARRPPTPRYPPPRTQNPVPPRAYPPPPQMTRPRAYPPPQLTQPGREPRPPQLRPTTQTSKPRPASAAATAALRKPIAFRKPEPRFRDVLWPDTPAPPAQNRVAFVCGLLYTLIHLICGVVLIYPLNVLTARMPSVLSVLVRAILPGMIGAVLCALTRFPLRLESSIGLLAYRKLLRMLLTLLVGVLLLMWGEWEALRQVARFVLMFVSGPLAAGTGLSVLLLYLDWLYELEEDEDA